LRLAKYLADAGIASRRKAEKLIADGRVRVNAVVIREQGFKVDDTDLVEFDGGPVSAQEKVYLLLNKPPGYLCSVSDPQGRPLVMELVKGVKGRVYPVGRLDYDTEGLLLMSNDGDFTNLMIHPRYHVGKKYQVWVEGQVSHSSLEMLADGVELEDGLTAPAKIRLLKCRNNKSLLEIEIHEGRKRQVKRMCAAIGHPVISLKRTKFGFLNIRGLKSGQYRYLTAAEIKQLCKLAKENSGREKQE